MTLVNNRFCKPTWFILALQALNIILSFAQFFYVRLKEMPDADNIGCFKSIVALRLLNCFLMGSGTNLLSLIHI